MLDLKLEMNTSNVQKVLRQAVYTKKEMNNVRFID